jgi:hypothetical protein
MEGKKIGCTGSARLMLYNMSQQEYNAPRSVNIDKLCNGVTVLNAGTTYVTWNGIPIPPGGSMTVGGNEREIFVGRVDIAFFTQTPPPTSIINSAWVIQKFFEDNSFI